MVPEDHCCNEIKREEMGKGFQLPNRSLSPSSVLECNSSMAFRVAASTPGLMSFDPGSADADASVFYPLRRCAATCLGGVAALYPEKQENSCNQRNEGEFMFGTSIVKQELEDQLEFVQPASFVYSSELVEALQASSSLGDETNNKSCDLPGSPVKRDSPERSTGEDCDVKAAPCSKRRKTVEKKVVCVPVGPADGRQKNDGPPSDKWAWRKYGQKPIKGSPYPRGYYRCSSSKGCCARKQVERSCTDPSMLIVTYTSDHNHPWPANRANSNSNAGLPPKQSQSQLGVAPIVSEKSTNISQEVASTPEEAVACINSSDNLFSLIINSPGRLEQRVVSSIEIQEDEPLAFVQDVAELCISGSNNLDDDDDFYADLGELPDSSAIFSTRGSIFEDDENRNSGGIDRFSFFSWSGSCGILGNNAVI